MVRDVSGKSSASASTYDSETKRLRIDTIDVVPLVAKPPHTIRESPLKSRLEKKACFFTSHTSNSENYLFRRNYYFFIGKYDILPSKPNTKMFLSEFQSKLLLKFCKWWTWQKVISNIGILLLRALCTVWLEHGKFISVYFE